MRNGGPALYVRREKLHARILLGSWTSVSSNSISGICSRFTRNFVPFRSNLLRARASLPMETPLFCTPERRQPELFLSPRNDAAEEERCIYIPVALSHETSGAPARRGNTEYHRQTLISFCRGQIVPSRSNFRGSSRALSCASTRRARIRTDVGTLDVEVTQKR